MALDQYPDFDTGSLAASAQSKVIGPCKAVSISLSGTWVGTVTLQRFFNGAWESVQSFTDVVASVMQVSVKRALVRLDFTRTSGTMVYAVEADDGTSGAVSGQSSTSTSSGGGGGVASSVTITPVATAATTGVNSAATSTTLLASNANRRSYSVTNTDANDLYLCDGTPATTALGGYKVIVPPGGYFEMDQPPYTGIVTGIWAADGTGGASVEEK